MPVSRRSGLGKGLSSLIPANEVADGGDAAFLAEIPTASVTPNPNQPRVHFQLTHPVRVTPRKQPAT